jgi:hypothetical protein
MDELLPALVTAGVGLVLLAVVLLLLVLGPVRRFSRANTALRAGVAERVTPLQALLNSRRPGRE